jgi:hypothetical protein
MTATYFWLRYLMLMMRKLMAKMIPREAIMHSAE